jgi:GT2 family glycosyltransferase
VSVVIPTWKRGDLLRKCLESLQRQTFRDFEIFIVSNGAGGWAEQLATEFGARLVRFSANCGFAAAVNAGINASKSPLVAILNDDAELDPRWLDLAIATLEENQSISFLCGKIYEADGRTIDDAGDALSMAGAAWRLGHGRADGPQFDLSRPLFAVSMTAAVFHRSVFDTIGILDEHFVSYLEDVDFSIRLWRAGLRGMYLPALVARHHGGASLEGGGARERFRLMTRNQSLLLCKHFPSPRGLRLAARIYWARTLWLAMAVRKRMLGAYLKGTWEYVRLFPPGFLRECIRSRSSFTKEERRAFVDWLRESERAIYEDIAARPRAEQDAYWRLYFALFRPRTPAVGNMAAASARKAGGKPEADSSSLRSSG